MEFGGSLPPEEQAPGEGCAEEADAPLPPLLAAERISYRQTDPMLSATTHTGPENADDVAVSTALQKSE